MRGEDIATDPLPLRCIADELSFSLGGADPSRGLQTAVCRQSPLVKTLCDSRVCMAVKATVDALKNWTRGGKEAWYVRSSLFLLQPLIFC
jgi:hypothetical protein